VEIEETEEFKEMVQQEKEECFNEVEIVQQILTGSSRVTMDLPEEEEEEEIIDEQVDTEDVDVVRICSTLIEIQEALEDARYTAAAQYVETARQELLRASQKRKGDSVKQSQQTLMDAYLLPASNNAGDTW
jgi:prophage tail gpP-like protein